MAQCEICCRLPLKANSVSHSNIKTIRRQKLNLQSKKIDGKKVRICARCLKTMTKPARAKKTTKKETK